MFNISTVRANKSTELITWQNRVVAAGGGFASNSLVIAGNFLNVLHGKSYSHKIVYLLPMLGVGINAARIPLVDKLNVGNATNTNFVDADFSQSTGLQGNGTSKIFELPLKPSQLGSSNNGGMGYWENNINTSGSGYPMGCYTTTSSGRFLIVMTAAKSEFRWGINANGIINSVAPVNAHYYGRRLSATSRSLFINGSLIGTNTTSDSAGGSSDTNIRVVGDHSFGGAGNEYWAGRVGLCYLDDGTLSDEEATDFHSVLKNYLMVPTGKPQS